MNLESDMAEFVASMEKMCTAAVHDFRRFPSEETYHRALGQVDGIVRGVAATVRELEDHEAAEKIIALARSVADRFLRELNESDYGFSPD